MRFSESVCFQWTRNHADVFAVWSDGHPPPIIDVATADAVAAGLLRRKLPGLAFVAGIRGDGGRARVLPDSRRQLQRLPFHLRERWKRSRGGVAVSERFSATVQVRPESEE